MLFHAHALDLMKDCSSHSHVFDAIKVTSFALIRNVHFGTDRRRFLIF